MRRIFELTANFSRQQYYRETVFGDDKRLSSSSKPYKRVRNTILTRQIPAGVENLDLFLGDDRVADI